MKQMFLTLILVTILGGMSGKQLLSVSTFDDDDGTGKPGKELERSQRATERINLSFPGTKW